MPTWPLERQRAIGTVDEYNPVAIWTSDPAWIKFQRRMAEVEKSYVLAIHVRSAPKHRLHRL
jgi:hypothetical protein